jgi:SAM-dependent methyltransferase
MDILLADATSIPLEDKCADLAVAFMSLHDIDAMPTTVKEVARILVPGGHLCLAIVHPINSCRRFEASTADARLVIEGDYLRPFRYSYVVERDGLSMTFHSQHRPLEAYFFALEDRSFRRGAARAQCPRPINWLANGAPLAEAAAILARTCPPTIGRMQLVRLGSS